jgi:hypothetical protein
LALGEPVERREQLVEDCHHLRRAGPLAVPGEVHDVGEQHRDLGEGVGDHSLALFEPGGDRGGQHIQQQPLGPLLLGQQQAMLPVQRLAAADRLA